MPLPIEPYPSHRQLRHMVTDRLRSAILEGQFAPGEWMRQERLAQDLGVSQMPVREALKELAAEGLVEHVPYRGVRVVEFTPADVVDLYQHRAFLEGQAAQAAAQHITDAELAELENLLKQMSERLGPDHLSEYRDLNRRFHQVVFSASRRAYLIRTLNQMWATFPTMLFSNFASTADHPLPGRNSIDVAEHRAIIDALRIRDGEKAGHLVHDHIIVSAQTLLNVLKPDA